jgi:hypothetical protein
VNRALNRMSSFSRVKINPTNIAAGIDTTTMKRPGRKGLSFLFFPILIALCAFLCYSIGNLRLLGRCISPWLCKSKVLLLYIYRLCLRSPQNYSAVLF